MNYVVTCIEELGRLARVFGDSLDALRFEAVELVEALLKVGEDA